MVAGIVAFAVGVKVAVAHPSDGLEPLVAAALIAGVMPAAATVAAWVTLVAIAAISWALVGFETIRYAEFRCRARRGQLT